MVMVRMKAVRIQRGWSQQQLAFRANVSVADVSRIETGRMRPYAGHAARLAKVLGLEPEKLLELVVLVPEPADARV